MCAVKAEEPGDGLGEARSVTWAGTGVAWGHPRTRGQSGTVHVEGTRIAEDVRADVRACLGRFVVRNSTAGERAATNVSCEDSDGGRHRQRHRPEGTGRSGTRCRWKMRRERASYVVSR